MFKLLAADQKEYGPVSADQIREWIAQGRANPRTKLQFVGAAEWRELMEFPEFANALRQAGFSEAPALASTPGALQPGAPPQTTGMAVTSLVLGILGLVTCGISSVAGLVLGLIALSRINKSQSQLGGRSLALAGVVVSIACLLLAVLSTAMLLPSMSKAKQKAADIRCMSNLRQLTLGLIMYATDYKETFPSGTNWCDSLKPYTGNSTTVFVCPLGELSRRSHYGFNARLAGRITKDIQAPAQTVLVFEIDGGWNVAGGPELLPSKGRHCGAFAVGFVDGHSEIVRPARLSMLRWEP